MAHQLQNIKHYTGLAYGLLWTVLKYLSLYKKIFIKLLTQSGLGVQWFWHRMEWW